MYLASDVDGCDRERVPPAAPFVDIEYSTLLAGGLNGLPPGVEMRLASGLNFTNRLVDSDGDGVADDDDAAPNDATVSTPRSSMSPYSPIIMDIDVDHSSNSGITLSQCRTMTDYDILVNQEGRPEFQEFPDGLVSFQVNGLTPGGQVVVTLTFPAPFPPEAKYYKVDEFGFHELSPPAAVINGNIVTLTLTDGGTGDGDNTANGVIVDPGGVAVPIDSDSGTPGGCFIENVSNSLSR